MVFWLAEYLDVYFNVFNVVHFDVCCFELFLIFPTLQRGSLANVSLLRSGRVPFTSLPGVPCVSGAGSSVFALTSGVIFLRTARLTG